jgi:hypothetical protein
MRCRPLRVDRSPADVVSVASDRHGAVTDRCSDTLSLTWWLQHRHGRFRLTTTATAIHLLAESAQKSLSSLLHPFTYWLSGWEVVGLRGDSVLSPEQDVLRWTMSAHSVDCLPPATTIPFQTLFGYLKDRGPDTC